MIVAPVKETDRPLRMLPYRDVRVDQLFARARSAVELAERPGAAARAAGGGLDRIGIVVRRHWIALETAAASDAANRFVVLQANDQTVQSILAALQQRSGRTPRTVGER